MKYGKMFLGSLFRTLKGRKVLIGLATVALVAMSAPPPLLALIPTISDHLEVLPETE